MLLPQANLQVDHQVVECLQEPAAWEAWAAEEWTTKIVQIRTARKHKTFFLSFFPVEYKYSIYNFFPLSCIVTGESEDRPIIWFQIMILSPFLVLFSALH